MHSEKIKRHVVLCLYSHLCIAERLNISSDLFVFTALQSVWIKIRAVLCLKSHISIAKRLKSTRCYVCIHTYA